VTYNTTSPSHTTPSINVEFLLLDAHVRVLVH
jgi:hypothetical protein